MESGIPEHTKGAPKPKTTMSVNHADMPEMAGMQLGDKVHLHIHGTVKGMHAKDDMSDGASEIEVNHMHGGEPEGDGITEGDGPEPTAEEAQDMPLDKLRKRLPHKDA